MMQPRALRFAKEYARALTFAVVVSSALLALAAMYYHEEGWEPGTVNSRVSVAKALVKENGEIVEQSGCKEGYGFLPCSPSLGGSLFLTFVYGGFLMLGAQFIGDGGEALLDLEVMPPSLIGGILLPILGAVPDAAIICVSCLATGTIEDAKRKISVGVGTLAGSTIMLITIAFTGSLLLGRCDLDENGDAIDGIIGGEKFDGKKGGSNNCCTVWSQSSSTGITYAKSVLRIKYFMMATSFCYCIAQIPATIVHDPATTQTACLIGSIVCVVCLIAYLADSVHQAQINDNEEDGTKSRHTMLRNAKLELEEHAIQNKIGAYMARGASSTALGMTGVANQAHASTADLYRSDGTVNADVVNAMFDAFDIDGSGFLDEKETNTFLRVVFLNKGETSVPQKVFDEMQEARTKTFEEQTPHGGGCCDPQKDRLLPDPGIGRTWFVKQVCSLLETMKTQSTAEESVVDVPEAGAASVGPTTADAVLMIILGTTIATFFSDSLVNQIDAIGQHTGIPNFVIGFVVCPLASNASELLSSLQLASRKKKRNASVTFAQIYAACTMNNCMCLGIFFFMVWLKKLDWDFGAEVAAIVSTIWIVSLVTCCETTIKTWVCFVAITLYPISLALVEGLHRLGVN